MEKNVLVALAFLSLLCCNSEKKNELKFISDPPGAVVVFYGKDIKTSKPKVLGVTPFVSDKIPHRAKYFQYRGNNCIESELIPFSKKSLERQDITIQTQLKKKSFIKNLSPPDYLMLTKNGLEPATAFHYADVHPEKKLSTIKIVGIVILAIVAIILIIVFWEFVLGIYWVILVFIFYMGIVIIPNIDRHKVILEFNTDPQGANVFFGNRPDSLEMFEYGVTPIKVKVNKENMPALIQFGKNGYLNSDIFQLPSSLADHHAYELKVTLPSTEEASDINTEVPVEKNSLTVSPFIYADNINVQMNNEKSLYATPDYRRGRKFAIFFLYIFSVILFFATLIYIGSDETKLIPAAIVVFILLVGFKLHLQNKIYAHTYFKEKIKIESPYSGEFLYYGNLTNSMSVFAIPKSSLIKCKKLDQSEYFQINKTGNNPQEVIEFPREKTNGYFILKSD
jgi:hypothetical protein